MNEYHLAHSLLYDYFATGIEGDVQFYVEEAKKAGSPVLEIGCGTGRILLPIVKAGVSVFGIDRAPAMLTVLREKVAKLDVELQRRVTLIEGDMRHFSLENRFSLITIPYRGINHLLTSEDQRLALTNIRDHLADNGRLIFNTFDPSLQDIASSLQTLGGALVRDSEFTNPETGRKFVVWESHNYDVESQIIDQYYILEELDDASNVVSKIYCPLIRRYIYRSEMQYLLELCGFRVDTLYGDFKRGPHKYGHEQVWVARPW